MKKKIQIGIWGIKRELKETMTVVKVKKEKYWSNR